MSQLLLVDHRDHICTLTISRVEKRNALNKELVAVIAETVNELAAQENIRVAVIRGAGEQAFSAGFDIGDLDEAAAAAEHSAVYPALDAVARAPFPVIALIHGFAVGGGLELALSCDIRVASQDARLGITPVKLGLVTRPEDVLRFINIVGVANTKELYYTGRLVQTARALEMGLVNYVLPKEEVEAFTYAMADEIAQNAPLAVKGTKEVINHALSFQRVGEDARQRVQALLLQGAKSRDLAEGQQAFHDRRKPKFEGR